MTDFSYSFSTFYYDFTFIAHSFETGHFALAFQESRNSGRDWGTNALRLEGIGALRTGADDIEGLVLGLFYCLVFGFGISLGGLA